jgi:NADPH:quinone reductase-like Zn-dependent oxidoreductase
VKAVVHDRYGPPEVLRIEEVPKPVPAHDEVLVRVRAAGVTRSDTHLRAGEPSFGRLVSGLLRPKRKILGHELAGEVEAVGDDVTEFAPGDRVFGALPYLALIAGAHAEYVCVPERFPIAHMPARLTFEEAGAICDGPMLMLNVLRPAGSLAGKRVLVFGASGSLGTAAVQLAKHFGAHVKLLRQLMLTFDALVEARERGRQLQAEAAAERLRPPTARRLLAEALRRAANRLDPVAVVVPVACSQE